MGGLQQENDPANPGLVAVSYPFRETAEYMAQYLLSIQDHYSFYHQPNVRSGTT